MTPAVLYLAGVPASGKSTILRRIIADMLPAPTEFKYGKLRGIQQDGVAVLGVYDGGKFDGTDRLANDVIADALAFCQQCRIYGEIRVIIAEGDRLLNRRFLDSVNARIIFIEATPEELRRRHQARRDTQDTAFLRRCRTKVDNICRSYHARKYANNTEQDSERLALALESKIKELKDGKFL